LFSCYWLANCEVILILRISVTISKFGLSSPSYTCTICRRFVVQQVYNKSETHLHFYGLLWLYKKSAGNRTSGGWISICRGLVVVLQSFTDHILRIKINLFCWQWSAPQLMNLILVTKQTVAAVCNHNIATADATLQGAKTSNLSELLKY